MVVLTEFRRTAALLLPEDTIEIAQIIEATPIAYLGYGMGAIYQHPTGIAQSHINDIITEVTTRMQFEETTECTGAHPCQTGDISQTDLVLVILVDIVLHLQHPTTVARYLHLGITAGGKGTGTVALRQFVEDGQELREGIETVFDSTQGVEHVIDLHDGIQREAKSLAGFVHHLTHGVERIAREETIVGEVKLEMDGYLMDTLAGTDILLPHVFQIGTGDEHKVVVADDLVGITHDTAHAWSMLYEIQFK